MVHKNAVGAVLLGLSYALNPTGTRAAIIEDNGHQTQYVYDELHRLAEERVTDTDGNVRTTSWTLDAVGNRLSQDNDGVQTLYDYDANDRLLSETGAGGTTSYSYDAAGNTLSKTTPSTALEYRYDSRDRLIQAITQSGEPLGAGVAQLSYTYDANGIRQSKDIDGEITAYLVDPNRDYAQVLAEVDGLGQVSASYTYGDDLLSQTRDNQTHHFHYDALGSTRLLSDEAGDQSDGYRYAAYGELLERSGGVLNGYLFAGEQFDAELGWYYNRARYLSTDVGRFTSMDTFQGFQREPETLNKYVYANANPIMVIDPSGRVGIMTVSVAAIGVGSAAYSGFRIGTHISEGNIGAAFAEASVAVFGAAAVVDNNAAGIVQGVKNTAIGRHCFHRRVEGEFDRLGRVALGFEHQARRRPGGDPAV